MIEQGYLYLNDPVHGMAEFFETRIENLEKSVPPSVPSRKRKKKGSQENPKKRKAVTYKVSED